MYRISDPWFSGMPFCASIAVLKLPFNADKIFLFLDAEYFVLLNEKISFPSF